MNIAQISHELGEETLQAVMLMQARLAMLPLAGLSQVSVTITAQDGVSLIMTRDGVGTAVEICRTH